MKLGTVLGAVWSSKKAARLHGKTLLLVQTDGGVIVAADPVGAGAGERVLLSFGGAIRELLKDCPVDAAIVAIVDDTEAEHVGQ